MPDGFGTWDAMRVREVLEIVAAAYVHTIRTWGPDRIAGFSPIPAMSPVSYASGARFNELIGAPMLSFYDWYADLPNASPQMFGDQTDEAESARIVASAREASMSAQGMPSATPRWCSG